MSRFARELALRQPRGTRRRRWLFVPYDQLTDAIGPLSREHPAELGIVLVESPWKASLRPYHRQKLALVLANLRHFALEQAAKGIAVRHVVARGPYRDALAPLAAELGPLRTMRPAERELREDLAPLVASGAIVELPHEGWITTTAQFAASQSGPPWRMDAFYRHVRRETGLLMRDGKPLGGKFSHDAANRKPWNGVPTAAQPPRFESDPIKEEVVELVRTRFASHPGELDAEALPATLAEAEATWMWARHACLPLFGPYEDAMSVRSTTLFHTRIAPLLHLHRLLPRRVVEDAAALAVPLASAEGFVRQVLGWREFVRHVHESTDGFRAVALREGGPLPPAYWGAPSGLACLDTVVADVWREGYSHHITRLMVLANVATLLDVSPRELTDWFWAAYTDAYDWVVEPNVLGMGTFAAGAVMTTKPYVSGAAYLAKMSDYCRHCAFDPKSTCPITPLYWAWLERHRDHLAGNPRMTLPLASAAKRAPERAREDAAVFERVRGTLARGERLRPGC